MPPRCRGRSTTLSGSSPRSSRRLPTCWTWPSDFGATSAGPRVAEREAERAQLQARVRRLQLQQEARQLAISEETIHETVAKMREDLVEGDIPTKRDVLSNVVVEVVMGPTGAELSYTFPLHEVTGMYTALPWGYLSEARLNAVMVA